MRHRSGITLAAASCVAALLLVTASAAGRADRVAASEPATGLVQLTARAWAFVAEDERSSNGALFVGDHAALVVDPGLTPAVASAFLAAVHSVTDRPIRRVVLTHWHPDHSLGITCLGLPDLDIVAHPLTRRALAENGAMARASLASRAPSPEEATALSDCRPALPRPLGPDDARIDLGGLTVEVFHPGLAHTRGDLVVWSPDESVLVTGDILMNGSCPSMGEGDTLSWLGVLSDLEKLAPAHVVPGHFAPGDTSTVTRFRAYLQAQVDHARDSIDAGLSADASARTAHFAAFASFSQFPQYGATFEGNARVAYRDLRRRPPAPGKTAGWRILERLQVGRAPHQITFSSDGSVAHIAAAGSDEVVDVDVAQRRILRHRAVPDTPLGVAVLPGGADLAVSAFTSNHVVRLGDAAKAPVATLETGDGPSLLTGPLPGDRFLVSVERAARLRVIDGDTFTLIGDFPTGKRPFPPAATRDGRLAFVPSYDDGRVTIIDLWNEKERAVVPVGRHPSGGTVLPGGIDYAVAVRGEDRVVFVNTASHQIAGMVEDGIGDEPFSVVVSPDGSRAFVNNTASDDVSVIDLATRRVVARVPTGKIPITLAVDPSGATLWVACEGSDEVDVIAIPDPAPSRTPASVPAAGSDGRTEVAVMGMIHSGHRKSATWGLDQVRDTIRRFHPDAVCAEIPPDRWSRIWADWTERGVIEDERLLRFPEYTDVLLPLAVEMGFTIEPCAAWTVEMSDLRQARIKEFESDPRFATEFAEYTRRNEAIRADHEAHPIDEDDPRVIHSALYDERTREELAPYDEFLNDRIGPGGWTHINESHYALIEKALARHRGQRVLVTFGAGHKYWLLEHLSRRDDVKMLDLTPYLLPAG